MKKLYPLVRVTNCSHFDIFLMPFGAYYCEKCNSIILCLPHFRRDFREIEENIASILNHESLHWVLLKEIGEEACSDPDAIAVYKIAEL